MALAACLLPTLGHAQEAPAQQSAASDYYACVQAFGKMMSPGPASASEIGEAAVWSCREQGWAMRDEFRKRLRARVPGATEGDVVDYTRRAHEDLMAEGKQAAIYAVVAARTLPAIRK